MKRRIVYIHGKGGSAAESAHYRPLFPGCEVIGLDYRDALPWEAAEDIRSELSRLQSDGARLTLIANSIGAYFCMCAGIGKLAERAYLISPIVNLERLILQMMQDAGVTEAELQAKGEIRTADGEILSRKYLQYVRAHPAEWAVPTEILFGSDDNLTAYADVSAFAAAHGAGLTVMAHGEHWFHTEAQMQFLDDWLRACEEKSPERILIETDRLRLFPASKAQMEAAIAGADDAELKAAYREMLDGCLQHPAQWAWYAMWQIERKDGVPIGDLCFKGLDENGTAEIGYGMRDAMQGRGYATEAVAAACAWALRQPGVTALTAETAPENGASQRVLEKCGFRRDGAAGAEGPRYSRKKQP